VSSDGSASSSEGGSGAHSTRSTSSAGKCGNHVSSGFKTQFSGSFGNRFGDRIDEDACVIRAGFPDEKDATGNTGARGLLLAVESR